MFYVLINYSAENGDDNGYFFNKVDDDDLYALSCPFSKHINEELAVIEQYEPNLYKAAVNLFGKSYEYTRKYREFQKMMKLQEKKINTKY